jgi:hypothetical protein
MEQASEALARYTVAVFDRTHGRAENENGEGVEATSDGSEAGR